jgi:WD40 repeat protein
MKKSGLFLSILVIAAILAGCTSSTSPSLTFNTPGNASAITWTPAGDAVVANGFKPVGSPGASDSIGVWTVANNRLAANLISVDDPHQYLWVSRLSFNRAGTMLLLATPYTPGSSNGFVSLYDAKQNTMLQSWEGLHLDDDPAKPQETMQDAVFSPDGTKIALAGSFYIRIIDAASLQELARISTNARGGTVNSGDERLDTYIAWSPDSSKLGWLILANLSYYNLSDGSVKAITGDFPAPNRRFGWSADGSTVIFENSATIYFVDTVTGSVSKTMKIQGSFEENHVKVVQFSSDGYYVVFCASEYMVVWNASSGSAVLELTLDPEALEMNRFEDIAWSPDSQNLAILSYGAKQILIYKLAH